MCGIAGMFGNPDSSVVHRMIKLIQHRGPDGHNFWADENISLGHSRLAIVDLSGSQQPMKGVNGQILVANGEIYNYQELEPMNSVFLLLIKHKILLKNVLNHIFLRM